MTHSVITEGSTTSAATGRRQHGLKSCPAGCVKADVVKAKKVKVKKVKADSKSNRVANLPPGCYKLIF